MLPTVRKCKGIAAAIMTQRPADKYMACDGMVFVYIVDGRRVEVSKGYVDNFLNNFRV